MRGGAYYAVRGRGAPVVPAPVAVPEEARDLAGRGADRPAAGDPQPVDVAVTPAPAVVMFTPPDR
ncbi:hypothetical protein ACFXHD_02150 [Streptomyces hydrogenans]|uniref:hypothetical protein n=1 Tax=Streptomyces hydrogenans TaxID=1873719 RepID=UPI0036BB4B16